MISFKAVSKSYGDVRALRDLNLDLARGEVFGYIGPNGAGKTTTMKILTGLTRNYRGTVEIDGKDIRAGSASESLHASVGYLPQDAGFQEWRTVEHALQTFGLLSGLDKEILPGRIDEVLQLVGIGEHRDRRIRHLSGGTVQKLRFAQAILHDPPVLVLDEPMAGLDPASRFQLKQIIRELADSRRLIFVSSHILGELEGLATRIGILHEGEIRDQGTPAELRRRYQVGTVIQVVPRSDPGAEVSGLQGTPVERVERSTSGELLLHIASGVDADDAMDEVLRRVLHLGLRVQSVRHLEPSLEDVYISLTSEGTK